MSGRHQDDRYSSGPQSNWGSDEKGTPVMVVAAPQNPAQAEATASRAVASLLSIVAMLVAMALAVAFIAMLVNSIYGAEGYETQLKVEQRVTDAATGLDKYRDDLKAQNDLMRADRLKTPAPPSHPRIVEIDQLRVQNAALRGQVQSAPAPAPRGDGK